MRVWSPYINLDEILDPHIVVPTLEDNIINMYKIVALFALVACASAGVVPIASPALIAAPSVIGAPTAIVRTPSLDSAIIKSERLGGNFAYSTVEGHAYAAVSPVISHVPAPVAVSYSASPVAIRSHALVPSAPLIL